MVNIPERYVPPHREDEQNLSSEEQQQRLEKSEKYRRMVAAQRSLYIFVMCCSPHGMQASIFGVGSAKLGGRAGCGKKDTWHNASCSHLCGCCRPARDHTVRGANERGPAINQGPYQMYT